MFRNYKLKNFNLLLIGAVFALTMIGIFVIGSANEGYQNRQILGMVLGLFVMVIISLIDFEFVLQFHYVYYVLTILLLLSALVFGDVGRLGARRWIDLGFIRFQPSELAKVLLVLFFARFFMSCEEELNTRKYLMITGLFAAVPLLLIIKEPDLSTTIVTFCIISAMLFAAGLSYKIVGWVLGLSIPFITIFLFLVSRDGQKLLNPYQGRRILAWLHPEDYPSDAYQQLNSIMAVGSGQLFGKGLNTDAVDSVKNGNYISEPQTDFIFAVAGEELGFIGAVAIVLLLLIITVECLRTAKKAKDLSGQLICVGMASLVGFQSFVNISVVTGLMPNTGLPLPFVSYGLTSLVTLYLGIGFVLNVGLQAKKNYGNDLLAFHRDIPLE